MSNIAEFKFLQQQGFPDVTEESANTHYKGLQFQPRIVGSLIILSILLQNAWLFLTISVILWINTLIPKANIFEFIYNITVAKKNKLPKLTPAPGPRRFAQGMAAFFMLITSIALFNNWMPVAYIAEAFILIAFSSLIFGKFCLGAYIYHFLKGNSSFANATCPWSK